MLPTLGNLDISKAGLPVFDLISIGSQTNLKVRVLGLGVRGEGPRVRRVYLNILFKAVLRL